MADLSTITPDQELDLSDYGLQPFTDNFLITDAGIEEHENGRRWFVELEPQTELEKAEELPGGVVREGGFLSVSPDADYDDPEMLVRIGVGTLKRFFKAVFNQEHGAIEEMIGEMVNARVQDDGSGFPDVSRVRQAV